jgi:HEAT repeat protein
MQKFLSIVLAAGLLQLAPTLDSASPKERLDAVERISLRGRVDSVDPLAIALMKEPSSEVRAAIVAGLARIGVGEGIPVIISALTTDLNKDVRLQAIESLQAFYIPTAEPSKIQTVFNKVKSAFAEPDRPLVPNPAVVDPRVNAALAEAMQKDSLQAVRAAAARALGSLRARDRVAVMIATMQSPQNQEHPEVRLEIVESLGLIGDIAAGPSLAYAAKDKDRRIVQAAVLSIGMVGYRDARADIENLFRTDRSIETRRRALEALSLMRDPGSVPFFESLLGHEDDHYRETAAEGLARIGHEPGVLKSRFETEKKPGVRNALAYALVAADQDTYFNDLAVALTTRQAYQAEVYIYELGKFDGKLGEVHRYLRSENATIRARMARIAGDIGDPSSRPFIQQLTSDKDAEVVREAIVALRKLT